MFPQRFINKLRLLTADESTEHKFNMLLPHFTNQLLLNVFYYGTAGPVFAGAKRFLSLT